MGTLKDDLKSAAALLKSGDNDKVIELLRDHIVTEIPDYRVLCFAALAYCNLHDYQNSYKIYKKAVEVDNSNPMAWKGAFKLFETESYVAADEFTLKICDFMEKLNDDKSPSASRVRRRIHVELKLWPEILANFQLYHFSEDSDALVQIITALLKIERCHQEDLLKLCFENLESKFPSILESKSDFCLEMTKMCTGEEERMKRLRKLAEVHPETVLDDWVQKTLMKFVCQKYYEENEFPEDVRNVKKGAESTLKVLESLRQNDIPSALEALDSVEDLEQYPDCLLFVKLLAQSENWEMVEKITTRLNTISPSTSKTNRGWLARAWFEMNELEKVKQLGDLKIPEFAAEQLKIYVLCDSQQDVANIVQKFPNLELVRVLYSEEPLSQQHLALADNLPKDNYQDLVIAAEIKVKLGVDANSLLVKAAKLNIRCSRAFFLLGKSISSKNTTKAKSLVERAVGIRRGNEEYIQLLDDLQVKLGVSPADRLKVFKSHLSNRRIRQKPRWLAHRLAELHLDLGNLSEAIDELQQLVRANKKDKSAWAKLADAYTRKGHLRAAVSSYSELAEMDDGHEFVISMIRVLLQLREFDEALQKCAELRQKIIDENLECCSDSPVLLDLTEAEIRLNLHETACGDLKKAHLKEALRLLTKNMDSEGVCKFSSTFKLLGDAFMKIGTYSPRLLPYFEIERSWQVNSPLEATSKAVAFYMTVLRFNRQNALSWYDVAIGLLAKYKKSSTDKDGEVLEKVKKILEHSLSLTSSDVLLSSIWTLLAEVHRLAEKPTDQQLHCLARALQLNKANDSAWLKVAVLCLEVGLMNEASRVLEQCIKYNPHNADAWCAWAQHAHLVGMGLDAMAMFRQALCIRPTPAAVIGYSSYLCDSFKKLNSRFDSARAALDFEPVIDLRDQFPSSNPTDDDQLLFHLGLLADLFGFYPESLECFQLCQNLPVTIEIQRAILKTSVLHSELEIPLPEKSEIFKENSRLAGMLGHDAKDSFSFLTGEMEIYGDLFGLIERNDHVTFRNLYLKCVKELSVPLFIAGLIVNGINLPVEFIRTMHDALPRHELIDFYPTVLPEEMDNGLRHLEQDGEEPFRYRHRTAKKLLEELRVLREKVDEEKATKKAQNEEDVDFQNLHL